MISTFRRIWSYIFGPKLVRIHNSLDGINRPCNYYPNDLEEFSQKVLAVAYFFKVSFIFSSPFWFILLTHKGTWSYLLSFRFLIWSSTFIGGAFIVRGIGRSKNHEYIMFLETLESCCDYPLDEDKKKQLRRYDFDFNHWPVDFVAKNYDTRKKKMIFWRNTSLYSTTCDRFLYGVLKDSLAFLFAHTIGVWVMYPGSLRLMNIICAPSMNIHRSRLVEEHGGYRAKLCAEDGNMIDTMFIDRRTTNTPFKSSKEGISPASIKNGNTLVICCEGNAGFYECGVMSTPMQCGYSVLGWNHPGFMCSTGTPFPDADNKALSVVMQYAMEHLGFSSQHIIIFAWSIGAFTAINAAVNYPDISGLVLDSAFADVVVFAQQMAPEFLEKFVTFSIRSYLNLNNIKNLRKYKGAISFIRREKDEVMNLSGPEVLHSNAGNMLFEDFLQTRFPNLFDNKHPDSKGGAPTQESLLKSWLNVCNEGCRDTLLTKWDVVPEECKSLLVEEMDKNNSEFPMEIGKDLTSAKKSRLVLYLANKYMHHYHSSHCTPLPPSLFLPPWKLQFLLRPDPITSDTEPEYDLLQRGSDEV